MTTRKPTAKKASAKESPAAPVGGPVDAGLGVPSPWDESVPAIDIEGLRAALDKVKRKGLPTKLATAGVLAELRSVYARAVHPYDPQSRVGALNQLLVRILAEWDGQEGEALRILYGIASGTRDTNLTYRREKAASVVAVSFDHFRLSSELHLVEDLAEALYADLLRYKRRIRRAAEAEEPTGDTPALTVDHFTHEEELISRIWQHVYGLRTELIAAGRLEADGQHDVAEDHREAAERCRAQLDQLIAEYVSTYGTELIRHGEAEWQVQALNRLVGTREGGF
jgi:hypothetical protein